MPTTADVAREYTALLLAGEYVTAGERYWAAGIRSNEPREMPGGIPASITGFAAARDKMARWFEARQIEDLSIDGPFVTGNEFALFMDMMITDRASGDTLPFAQIAVFAVNKGQITHERYFYE